MDEEKPLTIIEWVASALDDLREMPDDVKDEMGYALEQVQRGEVPVNSKPMHGPLRGVREIIADDESGTYRTMYTTEIGNVVYVLDAFKKKSKSGIATPRSDLERLERRLKMAREHHAKEQR